MWPDAAVAREALSSAFYATASSVQCWQRIQVCRKHHCPSTTLPRAGPGGRPLRICSLWTFGPFGRESMPPGARHGACLGGEPSPARETSHPWQSRWTRQPHRPLCPHETVSTPSPLRLTATAPLWLENRYTRHPCPGAAGADRVAEGGRGSCSPGSGGRKSEVEVWAGPRGDPSVPIQLLTFAGHPGRSSAYRHFALGLPPSRDLHTASSLCLFVSSCRVCLSPRPNVSFLRGHQPDGVGATVMTSFHLGGACEDPVSKSGHIRRCWGSGPQRLFWGGRHIVASARPPASSHVNYARDPAAFPSVG